MKTRRIMALLTALVMILAVVPGVAIAADSAADPNTVVVTSNKTMTANVADKGINGGTININGRDANSLYVYHSNWNQRNGYMGFDLTNAFSDEQLSDALAVKKATVELNCLDALTILEPTVSIVAIDNTKWKDDAYTAPEELGLPKYNKSGTEVTSIPSDMVILDKVDVKSAGTYSFDVTKYVANNLEKIVKDGVSFALINVTESIAHSGEIEVLKVLFEGKNGTKKPTLTINFEKPAKVSLALKAGSKTLYTENLKNIFVDEKYTPDESKAPEYLIADGKIYTRSGDLQEVTVKDGMTVEVKYTEGASFSGVAIDGGMAPMLPVELAAVKDEALTTVPVTWTAGADGKYTAKAEGLTASLTADVKLYENEYTPAEYYCSGTSSSSNFGWKTDVANRYNGGHVMFEVTFDTTGGQDRLISYGNASVGSFNGVGPVVRYLNADKFEYYSDGAWYASDVPCVAGKTYTIRTIVDMDARTYEMYVAEEGSADVKMLTPGSVGFRNPYLNYIDRFFFHGGDLKAGTQGDPNGCDKEVIKSHKEVWMDGFVNITETFTCGDVKIEEPKSFKWAVGKEYIDSGAPAYKKIGDDLYVRQDTRNTPSITTDKDETLAVKYDKAECVTPVEAEAYAVVGDSIVLPAQANVKFTNGQSLPFAVEWDEDGGVASEAGTSTITGTVTEFNVPANCKVTVKELEPDDKSELGKVTVATNNGGWNWYVEPSGTHIEPGDELAQRYEGKLKDIDGKPITYSSNNGHVFANDKTYMGWVEDGGDIVVAEYDHNNNKYTRKVIHEKLESDDHNNPAVVILPDGRIMAVYSMHTNEPYMYFRVSKKAEDISEWNPEQYYYCYTKNDMEDTHEYNATYPTVFMVHDDMGIEGNDVIYIGWRGVHWKPTMAKFPMPDENGQFFVEGGDHVPGVVEPVMGQTQVANTSYSSYDDGGRADTIRRPYTKYDYDAERNKIYITYTANHPDNDKRNHIYYMYLSIEDQGIYTAKDHYLQPLPFENQAKYKSEGANGTTGQWGVLTVPLHDVYPELVVFDASQLLENYRAFTDYDGGSEERRGWTWDISHNEKGEPCIVYVDITATGPGPNNSMPTKYVGESNGNSRSHHYYYYARWDKDTEQWVTTYLAYGGKWFHQNATQERCYSGGLTFDHNAKNANVIYLSLPTEGKYGNVFEIYRWESDDNGATWTKRQAITQDSPVPNARPNAIYNYKMDSETNENLGPRLLWISGEYRYWMNYEYKTGVKTDFVGEGFVTQDDPDMFTDAALKLGDTEITTLPVGPNTVTGEFYTTNISIGDGNAMFALAHYNKDNQLISVKTEEVVIPARSVPQTGVPGADRDESRDNKLSAMGEKQVVTPITYEADFKEGDTVKLFAWNMGVEHKQSSIISIPCEVSTNGSKYLYAEDFTYEGEDKLKLDSEGNNFNGWIGKGYNSSGSVEMNDGFYSAVTKTVFGNSGLHLYRVSGSQDGQGIMASHKLPSTDGKDFTLEFTMRYINEMSWQNIQNGGFTLSHGVPTKIGDTENPSAIQIRHQAYGNGGWNENGRNNVIQSRNSVAFDGGSVGTIGQFADISRHDGMNDPDRFDVLDYHKPKGTGGDGNARYDKVDEVYIHDYNDGIMDGALFNVKVNVHPSAQMAEISVFDGYRTIESAVPFNTAANVDWDANPIDTITFSIGQERWGEIYIDNLRMYLTPTEDNKLKPVELAPAGGGAMTIGTKWQMLPIDNAYVFFNSKGEVIEVGSQKTEVNSSVGTWTFNGGGNQKWIIEEAAGGYYLKGVQSNLYLNVNDAGATTLQNKENATVFTITETNEAASAVVLQIVEMIEDGTYEATMDAIIDDEE